MLNFFTPQTSLRSSEIAINTIANNIANANTPGYHRQTVRMADLPPTQDGRHYIGIGVEVSEIRRSYLDVVEHSLTANTSELAAAKSRSTTLRQIESVFAAGTGSLADRTQQFFTELERLSANPGDSTLRRVAVHSAEAMASEMQSATSRLTELRDSLFDRAHTLVRDVNSKAKQIADLNYRIRTSGSSGSSPNDLLDRRDQLVNELAELVDVRMGTQGHGRTLILAANGSLLVSENAPQIEAAVSEEGELIVRQVGSEEPLSVVGGELAGVLESANHVVGAYQTRIDDLASGLIRRFNQVHAQGVGIGGAFGSLAATNPVSDVAATLDSADLPFPPTAGELAITVTDRATGERRTSVLSIDPRTQSLNDVAAMIDGVDHLSTVVDPASGSFSIRADLGYGFDFSAQLETTPDLSGVTGSSVPRLSGEYLGADNDVYHFTVVGGGAVGAAGGLTVEVRDDAGLPVATLDLGPSYSPGSKLQIADGVSISFAAGTLNAGDTFSTPVVADSDTGGFLPALGLNAFFTGSSSTDIEVAEDVSRDPNRLAAARSDRAGDNKNLHRLVTVRDERTMVGGTRTFEQYLNDMIGDVGSDLNDSTLYADGLESSQQRIQAERDSYSGVDPNEEMVNLLRYQRAFQASAKVITVIDQMMAELVNIIR